MSSMMLLLIVWGVLTAVLLGLLIYRALLTVHEEDQIFLDRAEAALEREQLEVLKRIGRLDPMVRWLGAVSGALLLFLVVWWIYQGLYGPVQM